jgi:hypothetical protein
MPLILVLRPFDLHPFSPLFSNPPNPQSQPQTTTVFKTLPTTSCALHLVIALSDIIFFRSGFVSSLSFPLHDTFSYVTKLRRVECD